MSTSRSPQQASGELATKDFQPVDTTADASFLPCVLFCDVWVSVLLVFGLLYDLLVDLVENVGLLLDGVHGAVNDQVPVDVDLSRPQAGEQEKVVPPQTPLLLGRPQVPRLPPSRASSLKTFSLVVLLA